MFSKEIHLNIRQIQGSYTDDLSEIINTLSDASTFTKRDGGEKQMQTRFRINSSIALLFVTIFMVALTSTNCQKVEPPPAPVKSASQQGDDYRAMGDYEKALSSYDEAIKQRSDDGEAWLAKADIYYEVGRYEEALAAYNKLLRLQSYDCTIWLKKGDALYGMTKYEDALDVYDESLLRADYEDAIKGKVWVGKSMAYIKLGRLPEAEKCLTKVKYIIIGLQESYENALDR